MPWQPTTILRPDKAFATATETVRVTTDAGPGFLKAMGNKGGPHLLASDLVATQLAAWLGLPIFEYAIVNVTPLDEIQMFKGKLAEPGPAFITKEQSGIVWSGTEDELKQLINPEDIGKLVLFDTWTRNCDRHPPDLSTRKPNRNNVFLSNDGVEDGKFRLIAMDHTHCFHCGEDLNAKLSRIDRVKDERLYGLFPEFKPFIQPHRTTLVQAIAHLTTLDTGWVNEIVTAIPREWQVDVPGRSALVTQVCDRAQFVAETFLPLLEQQMLS